jgi:hypothetical protein
VSLQRALKAFNGELWGEGGEGHGREIGD